MPRLHLRTYTQLGKRADLPIPLISSLAPLVAFAELPAITHTCVAEKWVVSSWGTPTAFGVVRNPL